MATPQSTAAVDEHPADWAVWLLLSLFVAAILAEFFGWWGALAALPLSAGAAGLVHLGHVRTRLWRLSEIGPIDMVLVGCGYSGSISPRWTRRVYQFAGGVLLIGFGAYAYATLDDTEPGTRAAAVWQISRHFLELLGYVALKWVGFKNSTWRLLIAGEGLFRLTDPTRPWVTKSDVREPNSRLRTMRIYVWDQIERFHISDRDNGSTLHLNVRYPNTPVAQRMSYDLPSLSESAREQLEEALRQHIPAAPGRTSWRRFKRERRSRLDWSSMSEGHPARIEQNDGTEQGGQDSQAVAREDESVRQRPGGRKTTLAYPGGDWQGEGESIA